MTKDDTDGIPMRVSDERSSSSLVRRLFTALFAPRYTGKTETGASPNAGPVCPAGELDACVSRGRMIKAGEAIDVCRATWRDTDVVIKRYKHVGLIHSLRYTIKRSRACRAWANGRRLLALGIHTPRPLAYVNEHRGPLLWQSYLVTEYVDGPMLHSVLRDKRVPEGRKRRIVHQILRLIDRLESHHVSHGDMKHTNILCDGSTIVLTDLDGMQVHRLGRLPRRRHGRDLARFLRRLSARQEGGAQTARPVERRWEREQAPALVKSRHEAGLLWVNPDLRNEELEKALSGGRQAIANRFSLETVQSTTGSHVSRFTAVFNGTKQGVYFKEYFDRSAWDRLKHLVRPSRALRAMNASSMLGRHGFQSPQIIAVGDTGTGHGACFLATLEVANAIPIYKYFVPDSDVATHCSLQEKRQLLREFGQTVGRMHRAGIIHGDLRPGNVLARRADGRWELVFLDNERTRKRPYLPRRHRLKNLVQVNMLPQGISHTDRLRFFHAYLLVNPSVRLRYRRWAARIMTRTYGRFRRKGWV